MSRLIHDIEYPCQIGGSGHRLRTEELVWNGFRAELVITTSANEGKTTEEVLYIEGDSKHLRAMFEECLSVVNSMEEVAREDLNRKRAVAGLEPEPLLKGAGK